MRDIAEEDIDAGNLSYAEAVYLRDRGKLPADYEMPENDEEKEPAEMVVPKYSVETQYKPLEEQKSPQIGRKGGIVDESEEDYGEGWNNNQRRAELSRRGLSIDGNKEQLIDRLVRSDGDMLVDEDYTGAG